MKESEAKSGALPSNTIKYTPAIEIKILISEERFILLRWIMLSVIRANMGNAAIRIEALEAVVSSRPLFSK